MLHIVNNFFAEISSLGFGILFELVILISTYMLAWNFYRKTSKEKIVV